MPIPGKLSPNEDTSGYWFDETRLDDIEEFENFIDQGGSIDLGNGGFQIKRQSGAE